MNSSRALVDLFNLTGRVALVTGGAGPLGSTIALTLAELGATVVLADFHAANCRAAIERLTSAAPRPHSYVAQDLSNDGAADRLVAHVTEAHGQLDILVNNAAFTGTSGMPGYAVPFEQQTPEAFDAASRLNLLAPFALCHRAAPLLAASGRGSIINVTSIYGIVGPNMSLYEGTTMGNPAAYAATKGGLGQLTRYLSTVLAPNVRVNGFAPGGIARGQDKAFVKRYEQLTPLARMATEDDFRGIVAWLASDASAYVTGQLIAIDGGWTAW